MNCCRVVFKECDGCMRCRAYTPRRRLPKCSCCDETIKDEYLYDVGVNTFEILCKSCFEIYCEDNYRHLTDDYIEEE
jgi:hypothetical protein